jgi:hypothetical protein
MANPEYIECDPFPKGFGNLDSLSGCANMRNGMEFGATILAATQRKCAIFPLKTL